MQAVEEVKEIILDLGQVLVVLVVVDPHKVEVAELLQEQQI
jgi:hypothetical protein